MTYTSPCAIEEGYFQIILDLWVHYVNFSFSLMSASAISPKVFFNVPNITLFRNVLVAFNFRGAYMGPCAPGSFSEMLHGGKTTSDLRPYWMDVLETWHDERPISPIDARHLRILKKFKMADLCPLLCRYWTFLLITLHSL